MYIRVAVFGGINSDEVQHAHVGFKILSGQMPFRDFVENHWPAYWLLTAPFVAAFPFSVHAILAGRVVSFLALAGSWFLGLRLLGQVRGGRTRLAILIYTLALLILAHATQFRAARPDPLMVFLSTAGLCWIPARGPIRGGRTALLGAVFGLAFSVSSKVVPLALVAPAVMLIRARRTPDSRPVRCLALYGLGGLLGVLPTAIWIAHRGALGAFYFDVFRLNAALAKPWIESVVLLKMPIFLGATAGTVAWLSTYRNPANRPNNGPLVLGLSLAAGVALAFLVRNTEPYNFQLLVVPWAVGFAGLAMFLWFRLRSLPRRLFMVAALIGYSTMLTAARLIPLANDSISQSDLQQLVDLSRPGDRTCLAFAPSHPIFCHDVSEVANGWDVIWVERLRDPPQVERFRRIWRDAIHSVLAGGADIVVRREPWDVWRRAVAAGVVTPAELTLLDGLKPGYEVRVIGSREVWLRRQDEQLASGRYSPLLTPDLAQPLR
jgi:hypothetical protein